jgi:hypothetical protein
VCMSDGSLVVAAGRNRMSDDQSDYSIQHRIGRWDHCLRGRAKPKARLPANRTLLKA